MEMLKSQLIKETNFALSIVIRNGYAHKATEYGRIKKHTKICEHKYKMNATPLIA